MQQSKMLNFKISTNVGHKLVRNSVLIAICRQLATKWQSKAPSQTYVCDLRSSIVKSVFDCAYLVC